MNQRNQGGWPPTNSANQSPFAFSSFLFKRNEEEKANGMIDLANGGLLSSFHQQSFNSNKKVCLID